MNHLAIHSKSYYQIDIFDLKWKKIRLSKDAVTVFIIDNFITMIIKIQTILAIHKITVFFDGAQTDFYKVFLTLQK